MGAFSPLDTLEMRGKAEVLGHVVPDRLITHVCLPRGVSDDVTTSVTHVGAQRAPFFVLGQRGKNTASLGDVVQEGVPYRDAEAWEKGSGGRRWGRA